jgi:hypothetical protein
VRMLLNPGDYIIPNKDDFRVTAFVLAQNKKDSDLNFMDTGMAGVDGNRHTSYFAHIRREAGENADGRNSVYTGLVEAKSNIEDDVHYNSKLLGKAMPLPKTSAGQNKQKYTMASLQDTSVKKGNFEWQKLLHSYGFLKISQRDRRQEQAQLEEEKYMSENYYIRQIPAELAEIIVKTSVIEEIPNIENHLIIIGKSINNLYDLIRPLRARYLGQMKYIVILYPFDIPHAAWQRICMFEGILVVRGSGLEEADVRRAGIYRASQVVVLADTVSDRSTASSTKGSKKGSNSDALVDADAIFTYQCVKRMNADIHAVIEIVHQDNVSYLDPETAMKSGDIDYKFTPQFASKCSHAIFHS